jgi:hypothetical protein
VQTTRFRIGILATVAVFLAGASGMLILRRESPQPTRHPPRTIRTHEQQLRDYLFWSLQPVKVANCELKRFGEPNDGGYLLCGNLLTSVEAGYSYGISGYDGWGCDLSKQLRIPLHQYDCFDVRPPACPGGRTIFHAECVAGSRATIDGRPFDSLEHQIAANGDATRALVVKMDVEGAEWDTFLETPDAVFARIDQMVVEFHEVGDERFILAVAKLKESFHVAHLHFNNFSCDETVEPFSARAYEVLFVNKRIGVADGSPAPPPPHPLDGPNNPKAADCQAPVLPRK